jgi:hypothetical protein
MSQQPVARVLIVDDEDGLYVGDEPERVPLPVAHR